MNVFTEEEAQKLRKSFVNDEHQVKIIESLAMLENSINQLLDLKVQEFRQFCDQGQKAFKVVYNNEMVFLSQLEIPQQEREERGRLAVHLEQQYQVEIQRQFEQGQNTLLLTSTKLINDAEYLVNIQQYYLKHDPNEHLLSECFRQLHFESQETLDLSLKEQIKLFTEYVVHIRELFVRKVRGKKIVK